MFMEHLLGARPWAGHRGAGRKQWTTQISIPALVPLVLEQGQRETIKKIKEQDDVT